ncbi:MAG: cytidylyltransferase domain-containing protein [Brevinema sp.]
MKDTYTAVIPVRAGSQRLKNKNILPFGDSNLLIHKIQQLKQVPEIDQIVVSSDSLEMLEMARSEGVSTHTRDLIYADEKTKSFNEVVEYIASEVDGTYLLWTPCVCPIADSALYSQIIQLYKEKVVFSEKYDSLVCVRALKEYIWDTEKAINYNPSSHVPSQDLPDWFCTVNVMHIASRIMAQEWCYCYGKHPYLYEVNKLAAIDIDDEYDLEIAHAIYKHLKK